jgi:hypothetical protein
VRDLTALTIPATGCLADALGRLYQEDLEESGWTQVDYRQAGPAQHLLCESLLLLLRAAGGLCLAHLRQRHLGQIDECLYT